MGDVNGQIHAPPTEAEYDKIRADRAAGKTLDNDDKLIWSAEGGWCSACFASGVRVVHYGVVDRNFALCGVCIVRIGEEYARSSDTSSPVQGGKDG